MPATDGEPTYVAPNLIYHYVVAHRYLPPSGFLDALRTFPIPNPAITWILEWIEGFQHERCSVDVLTHLLDSILRGNKPSLPPEQRAVVLEAVNNLKAAQTAGGSDAQHLSESIISRLKSAMVKG